MQDAGEGRGDGFGDSVGVMGTWQICVSVENTRIIFHLFLSCLLQWE